MRNGTEKFLHPNSHSDCTLRKHNNSNLTKSNSIRKSPGLVNTTVLDGFPYPPRGDRKEDWKTMCLLSGGSLNTPWKWSWASLGRGRHLAGFLGWSWNWGNSGGEVAWGRASTRTFQTDSLDIWMPGTGATLLPKQEHVRVVLEGTEKCTGVKPSTIEDCSSLIHVCEPYFPNHTIGSLSWTRDSHSEQPSSAWSTKPKSPLWVSSGGSP